MQPRPLLSLAILTLLQYHRAIASAIPSGDTINNGDFPAVNSNNIIISPGGDALSQFELADYFDVPAQGHDNLGVGAAAAEFLNIIRQGLDNAGTPSPSVPNGGLPEEKDGEPVRTTVMEKLAPGDQYCPQNRFGPRNKPTCDTGSLMDVQYIFPTKSWSLRFGRVMFVPTMCLPASLQVYWCCESVGNINVMGNIAQNCEPFDPLNPQLKPLLRLGSFQLDTNPQEFLDEPEAPSQKI